MAKQVKLSKSMSIKQFDEGYWYAVEVKKFAKEIGIPSYGKLRKDELEAAVKKFLKTGVAKVPTKRGLVKTGEKDTDIGLKPGLKIVNYTNNPETKDWIVKQATKMDPNFSEKSGARYRLNRWREEQITKGRAITYGDLVRFYVKLNKSSEPFKKKIPSGRYINFLSDYLAKEKGGTHKEAIAAWHQLKKMEIPKTYRDWKKSQ